MPSFSILSWSPQSFSCPSNKHLISTYLPVSYSSHWPSSVAPCISPMPYYLPLSILVSNSRCLQCLHSARASPSSYVTSYVTALHYHHTCVPDNSYIPSPSFFCKAIKSRRPCHRTTSLCLHIPLSSLCTTFITYGDAQHP